MPDLASLEPQDVRVYRRHEAHNLTPWLADEIVSERASDLQIALYIGSEVIEKGGCIIITPRDGLDGVSRYRPTRRVRTNTKSAKNTTPLAVSKVARSSPTASTVNCPYPRPVNADRLNCNP